MHCVSNDEHEKWIEDYVEKETTAARKKVQVTETVIMQELEDMATSDNAGATARKPETMFDGMFNAIPDGPSHLASSNDEQNGEGEEDNEEDTGLGKLSDDDNPGWVKGTISDTLQHCIEICPQKRIWLHELTQPGWGMQQTTTISEIQSMGQPNSRFWKLSRAKWA
jgi:hypothetical protein